MKYLLTLFACVVAFTASSQTVGTLDSTQKVQTVKTSCGKCKFGMTGYTCELAVKIDGKTYYVDNATIDDFGDAHANDGFCNAVRQAKVQGEVVNGRFKVRYFELLPDTKKKKKS